MGFVTGFGMEFTHVILQMPAGVQCRKGAMADYRGLN